MVNSMAVAKISPRNLNLSFTSSLREPIVFIGDNEIPVHFLHEVWALIRGGRKFEVGRLFE